MTRSKVALGELFVVGSSKRVLKSQWKDDGVPFYRGREITRLANDGFVDNELFISKELYAEYSEKYGVPLPNDIVITAIGTIGNSYIVREDDRFYFKDASVLWLKKKNEVSSEFINLWLKSPEFFDQLDTGNGATVDTLTIQKLQSVQVDLPPLPEQQRIVGILDEAFDGIATAKANAEQNLQNARALFESHLQSVFTQRGEGWEKKPLTAVCDAIFAGGDVPKGNSSKTETDKYRIPIFTNGEKNKGLYGYTNMARVTEPSITISARGTIGYSEIRKESYYPAIRLIVVIPKKEILDLSFLYYAIESTDIGHSGTSIPQLTVPMVSGFTIPVPLIAVQQTIVGQLDALREETQRLESLYQRKLAALDELKKSLLHQAFSGML